jgi:hypothetical protein
VELGVKSFSDATLIKSLLGVYASVRGWANLWSMSACMDLELIKVTDRVVHVHYLADATQFRCIFDEENICCLH